MRHLFIDAVILSALLFLAPGTVGAQGPSAPRFETLVATDWVCTLPECRGHDSARRRSRLGHSVLVGAIIGASVGVLTGALAYEFCTNSESSETRNSCGGTVALVFGIDVAVGAAIGLLVGASEPSRGPVPTD